AGRGVGGAHPHSTSTRLTTTSEYRSPVFSRDGQGVYVLHGDRLELIALSTGRPTTLARLPTAVKLVGAHAELDGRLLVIVRRGDHAAPRAAAFTVATGDLEPLNAAVDPALMQHLLREDRTYGTAELYVAKTPHVIFGTRVDRDNVFLRRDDAEAIQL